MQPIAVLSGDKRQHYIVSYLNNHGYPAYIKTNLDFNDDTSIVCGMPFTKDNEYINCDLYSSYPIDTFIKLLKPGQLVFSGNIPPKTTNALKEKDVKTIDLLDNDYVVWNNAALTAEGLIAQIINNTDYSIQNANVLIIGFGKCGINIASRLQSLNSYVYIYDHTQEHLSFAKSLGYGCIAYEQLYDKLSIFDIVINTVPSQVLQEQHLAVLNNSCSIFDISSKPYGFVKKQIDDKNLSLITCPGIPGKTAPKSAGELIAQSIISYLERNGVNDLRLQR